MEKKFRCPFCEYAGDLRSVKSHFTKTHRHEIKKCPFCNSEKDIIEHLKGFAFSYFYHRRMLFEENHIILIYLYFASNRKYLKNYKDIIIPKVYERLALN